MSNFEINICNMTLSQLALQNNIPQGVIISFLRKNHSIIVDRDTKLTADMIYLINDKLDSLKASFQNNDSLLNRPIVGPKIDGKIELPQTAIPNKSGPRVIGKIEFPNRQKETIDNSHSNGIRLMKVAREFNIGKYTIVDFLVKSGFDKLENKPDPILTREMYNAIKEEAEKVNPFSDEFGFDEHTTSNIIKSIEPNKEVNNETNPDYENLKNENVNLTMEQNNFPIQKILFGSPGTGKSFKIDGSDNSYLKQLRIKDKSSDLVKTVFHPEYTYGDFIGKLMPFTNDDGNVEYKFYAGHFLKSLGRAYKNIVLAKIELEKLKDEAEKSYKREIDKSNRKDFTEDEIIELQMRKDSIPVPKPQNVALVIDEINRGNSSAIFGTIFQLLDRDSSGWSSYHIRITEMENNELLKEISLEYKEYKKAQKVEEVSHKFDGLKCTDSEYRRYLDYIFDDLAEFEKISLNDRNIKLPPNLSIIATMNTSDNSIYFMDSAFKRRWDWEFIDIDSEEQKANQDDRFLFDGSKWVDFVNNLNLFIKQNGKRIRKIEDKQIGYYFIKDTIVSKEAIKNKLQFFIWDSIFSNDKNPLEELIGENKPLITFGDFINECDSFIKAINSKSFIKE